MLTFTHLSALEILDSRGRPTLRVACGLDGGEPVQASVPSGASTGAAEALELRDGDPDRYGGLGCRRAVANVNERLARALIGESFDAQSELDGRLVELDGSENKSNLGANALLGVSIAFARALAQHRRIPLFAYLAELVDGDPALPGLTINLFSGGKHAGGQVVLQDLLVVPRRQSVAEALALTYAVYQSAIRLSENRYGARSLTADEGGLAPPFASEEAMFEDGVAAIEAAGYRPGEDVDLALDVAASHFFDGDRYEIGDRRLTGAEMIERLITWQTRYPLVSIEDGLAEEAWSDWSILCRRLGNEVLVLGDDLLCTNPRRIGRAIEEQAANALLLKVNQIGTLSEAAQSYRLAREAGWQVVVSARSGETEDNWLADLAVGWAGDFIKVGSITQSERLAKYNRLLEIEASRENL